MLRVVDAPAAIAARGFPASAQLSLPLWIEDDTRPGNSGLWELVVTGGRGHLVHSPEATQPLTIGARGLAALYAGTPMATLRLAAWRRAVTRWPTASSMGPSRARRSCLILFNGRAAGPSALGTAPMRAPGTTRRRECATGGGAGR